jgi:hypothetical protein
VTEPDVRVVEDDLYGTPYVMYTVFVDGQQYATMTCDRRHGRRLTWSQMNDIADGYREALTGYPPEERQ